MGLPGTMYRPLLLSQSVDLGSSVLEGGPRTMTYPPCVSSPFYSCLQLGDALFFLWSEIVWQAFTDTAKKHFSVFSNLSQTIQVSTHGFRARSPYCCLFYLGLAFERSGILTVVQKCEAGVVAAGFARTPWESRTKHTAELCFRIEGEEIVKKNETRLYNKIREEFEHWALVLTANTQKGTSWDKAPPQMSPRNTVSRLPRPEATSGT